MSDLLKLDLVTLKFGGLTALYQVSWSLPSDYQGVQGIIGPNGAGKSTLFNIITGIYKPSLGQVFFQGKDLVPLTTPKIARLGIARTFQNIRLLPHLSVLDNLRVVTAEERQGTFVKSLFEFASEKGRVAEISDRAHSLLDLVGLGDAYGKSPTSLPYGDQRKLEIARALMRKPRLLLLDEPAAGMNPVEKESLHQILKQVLKQKIAVLVIEHDMKFVMNLCQQITVLDQGSFCAQGTPEQIQNNPHVIKTYLGKARPEST